MTQQFFDHINDALHPVEHLEAENATLKAYNRQLVDALEKISNIKIDIAILTSPWSGESETLEVRTEAATLAEQALQTPPAKLALAEAEVLRAAEGLVRKVEAYYVDDDTICEITSDLDYAVEAMQEALSYA